MLLLSRRFFVAPITLKTIPKIRSQISTGETQFRCCRWKTETPYWI